MKKFSNIVAIVCLLTVLVFVISIYLLVFQAIGDNTPNKATIFSGVLSMIGGVAGAFSAYFIARWQLDKQLDLQYKKEKERIVVELKINKLNEVINIFNDLLIELNNLEDKWSNLQVFVANKREYLGNGVYNLSEFIDEQCKSEMISSGEILIKRYGDAYKYQIFYPNQKEGIKLIYDTQIISLNKAVKIVSNMDFYSGASITCSNFDYLWKTKTNELDDLLLNAKQQIEKMILVLEKELYELIGI